MNVTITNTQYGRDIVITNPTDAMKAAVERMRQHKASRRADKLRK